MLNLVQKKYTDISLSTSILHHSTTSFICMTIRAHTVLQKLFLGIKIRTHGNYVTLIIICHEHQNKLKIFYELYIDKVIRKVH